MPGKAVEKSTMTTRLATQMFVIHDVQNKTYQICLGPERIQCSEDDWPEARQNWITGHARKGINLTFNIREANAR